MKRLFVLCILLVILLATVKGQEPQIVVQAGHSDIIIATAYSPDSKHIVTASKDHTVKIWETASGLELRTLSGHNRQVNALAFSPDGTKLVTVSDDRRTIIWSFPEGKILKELKDHTNKVLAVDYSQDGKYFATCGQDKIIYLYDVKNYKPKELYKFKSPVTALKFYNNGEMLYAETNSVVGKNVYLTIPQGKPETWVIGFGADAIDFDSQDKKQLTARTVYEDQYISIINDWRNIEGWRKSKEPFYKVLMAFDFQDSTGGYNVLKTKGKENYRAGNTTLKDGGKKGEEFTTPAFFSKDGKDDIVAGNRFGDILFWRYEDLKYMPRTTNPYAKLNQKLGSMYVTPYKVINAHDRAITGLVSSPDGKYLVSADRSGQMKLWDVERQINIRTFTNGKAKPVTGVAFDPLSPRMIISAGKKDSYLVDLTTLKVQERFELAQPIEKFTISHDQKRALVAYYNSSYFHLWDWQQKKPLRTFKGHLGEISTLAFAEDGEHAISTAAEGKKITWNLQTGEITDTKIVSGDPLKSEKHRTSISYKNLKTLFTTPEGTKELFHMNRVTSYGFTPDQKFAYTASMDGSVNLINPKTGNPEVKLLITEGHELMAITRDFYYMAGKEQLEAIAFRYNNRVFPFEQFDLLYNRPDVVLTRMGYQNSKLISAYEKAYGKRKKLTGQSTDLPELLAGAPTLNLDLSNLKGSTGSKTVSLPFSGSGNTELERLHVAINGVPVVEKPLNGTSFTYETKLLLSEGLNRIKAYCIDSNGLRSLSRDVEIYYLPEKPVEKTLYLVTIGASEYQENSFNLNYASKDAKDVASLFAEDQTTLYSKVVRRTLLNREVTRENISQLRDLLEKSAVDDQVIIFFAGHGLLSSQLDYYLATFPVDFSNPATAGFSYRQLEDLISKIPARNRVVMIDACHSGEVDKESVAVEDAGIVQENNATLTFRGFKTVKNTETNIGLKNTFSFMRSEFSDLREHTGAFIISSAGGAEYALESSKWQNGVFTFYLKKGLLEGKADLDGDKRIFARELQEYVAAEVYRATGGKQQPTLRTGNLKKDILIREL